MRDIRLPSNELSEFDLPRVCVVTGKTDEVVFKDVKFRWYPRWVSIFVIINLLIAAILAMVLTKKVNGKLPFTEEGYATWRRAVLLRGLSILLMIVLFVGGIWLMIDHAELGGIVFLAGLALPVAVYAGVTRGKVVTCLRIADGQITLRLPSDAAADAIREHLHAGALTPRHGQTAA